MTLEVRHVYQHEPCGLEGWCVSYYHASLDGVGFVTGKDPDCPLSACVAAIGYELWRLAEQANPTPRPKKPSESARKSV